VILVNSYGGTGTTLLIDHLREFKVPLIFDGTEATSEGKIFKHVLIPVPNDCLGKKHENGKPMKITKAIYLYANPVDAIKTFYRKRQYQIDNGIIQNGSSGSWVTLHCFNIMGDHEKLLPQWNIGEYASEHVDHLFLESHFCQWANVEKLRLSESPDFQKVDYPIMFLKYESMWDNLEQLREFLNLPEKFVSSFPQKRERQKFDIDEECCENLTKTYSNLIDMQNSWPGCVILNQRKS